MANASGASCRTQTRWTGLASLVLVVATACAPARGVPPSASTRAPASPTDARLSPSPTSIPFNTTRISLTHTDIPGLGARTLLVGDLAMDQRSHLLYLTDRTGSAVHVFDVAGPEARHITAIPLPGPPNDLVIAADLRRLFVSLSAGRVAAIDLNPASPGFHTAIATLETGGRGEVGALGYATREQKLFVANPTEGLVIVIDAARWKVNTRLDGLDKSIGRFAYRPSVGKMYLTSGPALYRFDGGLEYRDDGLGPPTPPCIGSGVAIDAARDQALVSCGSAPGTEEILRWDLAGRRVTATYDQIGNADAIVYSEAADRFFVAAPRFGRGPVIGMYGGERGLFVTNVPTTPASRSVAYDETNHVVYTQGERGLLSFLSPPARTP